MKWSRLIAATVSAVAFAAMMTAADAADVPPGAARFTGRVAVTARDSKGPTGATFAAADGKTYELVMDAKGVSLVGVMQGQSAEVYGEVAGNSLKVLGYVDPLVNAGHEFWRRMRCLACVVLPATVNSATPKDLRGAEAVTGRPYSYKREFTAWTRDAKYLWVAADNEILQFDLAARTLVKSYGKADGLPDQLVYQLASDGKVLWIVHRGGVAALALLDGDKSGVIFAGRKKGEIVDLGVVCKFARILAGVNDSWLLTDAQTVLAETRLGYKIDNVAVPALPTGERIAKAVEAGIWSPHWERRTAHFIENPVKIGAKLYAGSYGDIYELDLKGGKWTKIADGGFDQVVCGGRLYYLSAKGLNEYDPNSGKTEALEPPAEVRGRYTQMLVAGSSVWLASEPVSAAAGAAPAGGGVARFDLAARKWQTWQEINKRPAKPVACLAEHDGAVWAVTMEGKYVSKSAHPGMTTTRRQDFQPTSFCLNRFDAKTGEWESHPLALAELGRRLICGQDGARGLDTIIPQAVESLSVGPHRIFAVTRLVPKQFFGGYWPCIDQVASRADDAQAWAAKFEHRPEQLDLQGEQPTVLNISTGQLTLIGSSLKDQLWEAVGQDLVLGVFVHGETHWAVTGECVGFFDEAAGAWKKLAGPEFRWYWRVTAALDDGRYLYVGSDRGLVSRLDTDTGRFELMTALKDRAIARIVKSNEPGGAILVSSTAAPLGLLPVQLADSLKTLDADAARFDGKTWTAAKPGDVPPAAPGPRWSLSALGFRPRDYQDKTQGNFLCLATPGQPQPKPRYYLKEAFFPLFLTANADGSRLWISTYTGLTRLDVPAPAKEQR